MKDFLTKLFSLNIITSLFLVLSAIIILFFIKKLNQGYKKKHDEEKGNKETIVSVSFGILRFFVIVTAFLLILQVNGINVTGVIAGLGIVSAIFGLALQDFLKDIIMGVNIISDHFFSVGECVEFEGREGVVVAMTLKTTKIEDLDDKSVFTVCNRNISQIKRIETRLDIDIPISYGDEITKVDSVFDEISKRIASLPDVKSCSFEGTEKFDSSSINYRLRIICEPIKRPKVRRSALKEVQYVLGENGMHIPFNQLDVHFDK